MLDLFYASTIAQMRGEDLRRDAEVHRIVQASGANRPKIMQRAIVWIGGQMIVAGEKLQRPYTRLHSPV